MGGGVLLRAKWKGGWGLRANGYITGMGVGGGSGWVGLNCAVACGVRCSAGVVRVQ